MSAKSVDALKLKAKRRKIKHKEELVGESLFDTLGDVYDQSKLKMALFIFVAYIIINSDIFAMKILQTISPKTWCVQEGQITDYGVVMSGAVLAVSYLIFDLLNQNKLV